jgi:outer membrane lipoprotein-sorting protein
MRVVRLVVALLFAVLSSPNLNSQDVASSQRDTQALLILGKMIAATGWNPTILPQDAKATGTIARYRGDYQDSVGLTIKAKGPRLYRADVLDPNGPISTILNGDAASVVSSAGTRSEPFHSALAMRPAVFPFFAGLLAFSDPTIVVQYGGTETIADQQCYRVDLSRPSGSSDPLEELRSKAGSLTIWISAKSFLPFQIEYIRISSDNPSASRPVIRQYSDYRVVNGFAIPFHQEQRASDQLQQILQLDSVVFNSGISDTDFALPVAQD